MGVVADVARVPVGVIAAAMLAWRAYRSTRERLLASAILLVGILLVGNDTLLMALGSVFLIATLVPWSVRRGGRDLPKSLATPGHA